MSWLVCPRCHFSQMPAERCRRCGEPLAGVVPAASDSSAAAPPPAGRADAAATTGKARRTWIVAGASAAVIVLLAVLLRPRAATAPSGAAGPTAPTAEALDLSGNWRASVSKTIGADSPRPVLKEIAIETDRSGSIRAARVVFTDPGRGGAGAGYRTVADGPRRLSEAQAAIAQSPTGAILAVDFLDLPGWVPDRARSWKAFEGGAPGALRNYLLVESLETDYLIQAGINASGFLSYAFFSPAYAPVRGKDELSRVIHPEPGASLAGFRNLVWDLSGAADFLTLELPVTVSGPEGGVPDRVVLKRD